MAISLSGAISKKEDPYSHTTPSPRSKALLLLPTIPTYKETPMQQ